MNLDSTNKWLTLSANLGVLAGIVFLGVEINQNSRAIDTDAAWSRMSVANDLYEIWRSDSNFTQDYLMLSLLPERELKLIFEQLTAIRRGQSSDVDQVSDEMATAERIRNQLSVEQGYWAVIFRVDSSEEQLENLSNLIKGRLRSPVLRVALEFTGDTSSNVDFQNFLQSILVELDQE